MTGERDKVVDLEARGLRYRVRVVINHPSDNLDIITRTTGLMPKVCSTSGEERFTPAGTRLPGAHAFSTWSYSRSVRDSRAFSQGVRAMIDALIPAADAIKRIGATGGRAQLILELEGQRNIGDAIEAPDLARLAELGLSFGIEVYPEGL